MNGRLDCSRQLLRSFDEDMRSKKKKKREQSSFSAHNDRFGSYTMNAKQFLRRVEFLSALGAVGNKS